MFQYGCHVKGSFIKATMAMETVVKKFESSCKGPRGGMRVNEMV